MSLERRQFNVISALTFVLVFALLICAGIGIYFGKLTFQEVFAKIYEICLFVLGWLLRDQMAPKGD